MPRTPIIFQDKQYKSKAEFTQYIRNLIYNVIGISDNVKESHPSHYNILIELLKRHPRFESKTQDMCNLRIFPNKLQKNALGINIINKDGSETDISWRQAIDAKPPPDRKKLFSAMRHSVKPQTDEFKRENKPICKSCSKTENMHVDHIKHFEELAFNFIKIMKSKNYNIPNEFGDVDDDTNRKCFLKKDESFETEWINFHREHATLQLLCAKCNLSRAKSKNCNWSSI
jgi:5-methylcytosine-specific restriction endonuclease McrA